MKHTVRWIPSMESRHDYDGDDKGDEYDIVMKEDEGSRRRE